ncbi:hypothetical protein AVEN_261566-1 [Araneus ventricosus]|uniref:Uncharacterized protein n=1 Tax=Araneus ventricosus TaxID=182803 RepID=A0A4Y2EAS7_ARAVE|nr:hypothetical protein AVEN_261566-1 [Araneus ventricosus]
MGLQIKPRSSTISGGGTMTEAQELRVTSPEQLPDLVPLSLESSSRRVRSQSVSIPLDHEYIREIGVSLRRFSNEFENRFAERNSQPRRSSMTCFLNWRS